MKKKHTDIEICKRFLRAFDLICAEKGYTADELAQKLGTSGAYISQLRKKENPQLRASMLAVLTDFGISSDFLLTGNSEIKYIPADVLELLKKIEHNQGETISKLLEAVFEFTPDYRRTIDELINQMKRRNN